MIDFKRVIIVLFVFTNTHLTMVSQSKEYRTHKLFNEVQAHKQNMSIVQYNLFTISENKIKEKHIPFVTEAEYLNPNKAVLKDIINQNSKIIELHIPTGSDTIILEMFEVNFLSDGYQLRDSDGENYTNNNGRFYRGVVKNNRQSLAIACIYEDELRIVYSNVESNYRIQKTKEGDYIHFHEQNLLVDDKIECFTSDPRMDIDKEIANIIKKTKCVNEGNCIEVYLECDYQTYLDNNSDVLLTEDYVKKLMNEVITLYEIEDITILISEIFVWSSPDPYALLVDPIEIVYEFMDQKNASGYNGRLAHLLSTRGLGGVAFRDVLCSDTAAFGISTSLTNNILPFPLYSISVKLVTHELGHNLGPHHTHNCVWNGDNTQIDDCGNIGSSAVCFDPNNPIIPEDGGTIMSYCEINFLYGFGPQPGDMIRERFNNAPCNTGCGEADPPQAPQNVICTAISSTWINVTWDKVEEAIGYKIYRSHESQDDYSAIATVSAADTSYRDSGLIPENYYCYKIITYSEGGNSDFSNHDCDTLFAAGDIQATIESVYGCPGNFTVPIVLDNAQDVYRFTLSLEYQSDKIEFLSHQNENPALINGIFMFNETGGVITLFWMGTAPLSISNDTLLELVFESDSTELNSIISWDTIGSNCFFMDSEGSMLIADYINGNIVSNPVIIALNKPIGSDTVCINLEPKTDYYVLPHEETATYQWVLSPSEAGDIVENNNEISIIWSTDISFQSSVDLYAKAQNHCNDAISPVLSIYMADPTICGVGLNEHFVNHPEIILYPNPSNGIVTVEYDYIQFPATFHLTNSSGEIVYSKSLTKKESSNSVNQIVLPSLPAGLYYVNIKNGVNEVVRKLIVQ